MARFSHPVTRPFKSVAIAQGRITVGMTAIQGPDVIASPGEAIAMLMDVTNTGKIFVGPDSTVTVATGFPLSAGDVLKLSVDNLNDLWFIADTTNQNFRYIVEIRG